MQLKLAHSLRNFSESRLNVWHQPQFLSLTVLQTAPLTSIQHVCMGLWAISGWRAGANHACLFWWSLQDCHAAFVSWSQLATTL